MQRSACGLIGVLIVVSGLCGCASSSRQQRPLPNPLLVTSRSMQRPVRPPGAPRMFERPVRRTPAPAPAEAMIAVSRSWYPPGGIKRSRWHEIVVHHSASPRSTPEGMHEYHLKQRGWANGLGYHFVIGNGVNTGDGEVYVSERWRKQIQGAHCKTSGGTYFGRWRPSNYYNDKGIGICLVGNFEDGPPTARQLAALRTLTAWLCDEAGIDAGNVYGHGEVTHRTACPGQRCDMSAIRSSVRRAIAERQTVRQPTAGAIR